MALHYSQQTQAFVLRLPEHLEEGVKQRLKEGSMDGVQLTARPDGAEGLRECLCTHVGVHACNGLRSGPVHERTCGSVGEGHCQTTTDALCLFARWLFVFLLHGSGLCLQARHPGAAPGRGRGVPRAHR